MRIYTFVLNLRNGRKEIDVKFVHPFEVRSCGWLKLDSTIEFLTMLIVRI